jgi:hypothetical protein
MFPAGLNHGVFIGFHGQFNQGGTANDENPFIFANPVTGHYFDFISNNEPNIGHLDEAISTSDSLFIADISSTGDILGATGPGQGVIYQIKALNHKPKLAPIGNQTIDLGNTLTVSVSATDSDPNQSLTFSLAPGSPRGATINPQTGILSWTPDASAGAGNHAITVVATDNGSPSLSDAETFLADVVAENHAPLITSIPLQTVAQTQTLILGVAAFSSDPDSPAQQLSYSLDAGNPAGASIDPGSGVFHWTPSLNQAVGTYAINVRVTDDGTPPLSATRTVMVNVLDGSPPPFVSLAQLSTRKGFKITLGFSEALDSQTANNANNYLLVSPGRDKKFGTRDDRLIPLIATYNPKSHSVTLTARSKVSLSPALGLLVFGASAGNLASASGKLLDGNDTGQPGGNYLALVTRRGVTQVRPLVAVRATGRI